VGLAQIPSVADGLLHRTVAGSADGLAVGSPDWFAWLADDSARSFWFQSLSGSYTARKERRRRGGVYWVAYRTVGGRQHKAYLGKADDLTPERLNQVAMALATRVADATGLVGDAAGAARSSDPVTETGNDLLLATKLFVPRPRPDMVARPRLLARLDASLETGRCSLLSAPAGAGKTSLLA